MVHGPLNRGVNRRRFLATACAGCAAGLTGCLAPITEEAQRRHPFADRTLSVAVENNSDTDLDVTQLVLDSAAFWEANSEAYAGFDVSFELTDDASPDIRVAFVDSPEACHAVPNWSPQVLGCAPLIRPEHRISDTVRATVVAYNRPVGKVRITTKHEFGHLLGLYHDDEPLEIMSNRPEHRIPLYEARIDIWEQTLDGDRLAGEGLVLHRHGIDRWNADDYAAASASFLEAGPLYVAATERFESARSAADVFEGHPRVETVDLPALRTHLGRLVDRMGLAGAIVGHLHEAAESADAGAVDAANEHLARADEAMVSYHDLDAPQLRDVAIALGLVRGFDRDEPVAPIDEAVEAPIEDA